MSVFFANRKEKGEINIGMIMKHETFFTIITFGIILFKFYFVLSVSRPPVCLSLVNFILT